MQSLLSLNEIRSSQCWGSTGPESDRGEANGGASQNTTVAHDGGGDRGEGVKPTNGFTSCFTAGKIVWLMTRGNFLRSFTKRGSHLTSALIAVAASAAIIVFLLTNLSVTAQRTEMGKWLNTGSHDERTQKLVSLGIRRDEADLAPYDNDFVWRRIRSESEREVAVLFLPCGGMFSASIHVAENRKGRWHVTDSAGFDCHYDESVSFEVAPLRNPNADDVLVHHDRVAHGTGFVQQNFGVFIIRSGKLRLVLDSKEAVDDQGSTGEKHQLRLRSKFVPVGASEHPGIIEETRCERLNGRLSIQRRQFNWDEAAFRFHASKFGTVNDIDGEPKPICR